ncbi:Alpha/Beta hydrolase protein [Podospora aff. communis PSN243]|uniref:Alpha/Beta hydrolase protein n=1 Tax=Podospora aff. communis PSN243 TaxID=3040156 RepID=A0AAV9GAS0_9PEZI|nr:Alpha/Beta hydrolase protein [Podospora aff. communis PSN243]
MAGLRYDPELLKLLSANSAPPPPEPTDVFDLRKNNDAVIQVFADLFPTPKDVEETIFKLTAKDGTSLPIHRLTPPAAKQHTSPQPAIIFVHGGGMVSGSVSLFKPNAIYYAAETGLAVFSVGYRLAPEFPFPTPVEDVYSAVKWLQSHATEHNVDPARIAICGMSAGGGLAAGVALKARDEGLEPPLAKQVLIYPMLDDRAEIGPEHPLSPFLTWTAKRNEIGWDSYLGEDKSNVSPYAAPARATDLSGLPRTFIDVGGLDLFRDEDIAYAGKLAAANVDVEFHLYPGLPHGWDLVARGLPATIKAEETRVAALSDF